MIFFFQENACTFIQEEMDCPPAKSAKKRTPCPEAGQGVQIIIEKYNSPKYSYSER